METAIESQEEYWSRPAAALLASLGSGTDGLEAAEALRRLQSHGPNAVEAQGQFTALRIFLQQFASPLVLVLVFGAVVSVALHSWVDAAIILAIIVGSALLGFAQEYRASRAVAKLRRRLALTTRVLRSGKTETLPASAIVPGDVVLLSAGNLVPADGIVLSAKDFLVAEASLTGESFPVEKQPGVLPAQTPLAGRSNCVFLGTSVQSGTASVLILRTGRDTAFGTVAERLKRRPQETDFARGIRQFGYLLVRVMIFTVLFVLVTNQLLDRPVIESLLFAVALAVGLSPELLPAILRVTLSHGARAMAARGVIVRRPEAIENLGSMDILCTDKTGTLTEGVLVLDSALDAQGEKSAQTLQLAHLNAAFETGIENPLDAAIVAAGEAAKISTAGFSKIDEIPYDFIRKRLTIVVENGSEAGSHWVITKGAFDSVLGICSHMASGQSEQPLDEAARTRLNAFYREKGSEGFRVLAVAMKRMAGEKRHYAHADETGMAFVGFLLFFDPPKPDAGKAISHLARLGIRIKVITGDNRYVAAHVARAVGLDSRALLTGAEIASLRDEALWQRAEQTDLFVEVDPQQKERIVRALQRTGHAVGYIGDGINDAPALHVADVGISVDQAVDVARESADIVLLRPSLDVLRGGVEEGRRTFANTMKYICITTSANFGNMMSMALMTPLLPFLPLAAKQILLNNFLSDLPSVAISTDRVDVTSIEHAQRWDIRDVRRFMVVFGLVSSIFDLLTFLLLLKLFKADEATFQTAWFVVSLLTELAVVLALRTRHPMFASRPSRLLLWSTLAVGVLTLGIPYFPPLVEVFDFVPLPWHMLASMVAIVVAYIWATEAAKTWFYRKHAGDVPARAARP